MNTNENAALVAVPPQAPGSASERESRKWWAVDELGVRQVIGYTCAPVNPTYWWIPQLQSSMAEGHHLFATEVEAIDKVVSKLAKQREEIDEALSILRLRRQNKKGDS